MFGWDGSDVTPIISQCDIHEAKYDKTTYWILSINDPSKKDIAFGDRRNDNNIVCMVKTSKSKNPIPCLIDELKPVFGLQKLGTHWCRFKGKVKILIRCVLNEEGHIKEEINLNMIDVVSSLLKMQIQEIFAFRELLGITCSYTSSIILRDSRDGSVYPVSFYEPNMVFDQKVIPVTVLEKWFDDDMTIDMTVQRLMKIRDINQIGVVLHNIRNKIEETIERVDRRTIGFEAQILGRISERLQTSLTQ